MSPAQQAVSTPQSDEQPQGGGTTPTDPGKGRSRAMQELIDDAKAKRNDIREQAQQKREEAMRHDERAVIIQSGREKMTGLADAVDDVMKPLVADDISTSMDRFVQQVNQALLGLREAITGYGDDLKTFEDNAQKLTAEADLLDEQANAYAEWLGAIGETA